MFSLNSANSVTKIFVITVKGLKPATSCVRDQNATTAPARHMWETGSLNWAQFMLQWFIRFPEFAEFTEFNESSAPFRKNSNELIFRNKMIEFHFVLLSQFIEVDCSIFPEVTSNLHFVNIIWVWINDIDNLTWTKIPDVSSLLNIVLPFNNPHLLICLVKTPDHLYRQYSKTFHWPHIL